MRTFIYNTRQIYNKFLGCFRFFSKIPQAFLVNDTWGRNRPDMLCSPLNTVYKLTQRKNYWALIAC